MKPNRFLEKRQKCSFCGNESFLLVDLDSCATCENNGIKDEEGDWVYRALKEGETREEVDDDSECLLGNAYGDGCCIMVCSQCDKTHKHIPMGRD
jgi:hypothetical protein